MKKIIMMLATISLSLSLVACGGSKGTDGEKTTVEDNSTSIKEIMSKEPDEVNDDNPTLENEKNTEKNDSTQETVTDNEYVNLSESKGFVFDSNGDGTCTLSKIGTCNDKDIVIPEKAPSGDKVTMIDEYAFYGAEDVNSIVLVNKKLEINEKAFQSCEAKKVVIVGCDIVIGENAFSYSEDITEIYISDSNIEMEAYAFYDAGKDMSIKIVNCTGLLDEKAFQSCRAESLAINDSTLELGENVFSYCEDLTDIAIGNCTIEFDAYAFYDAGDDATVTFSDCKLDIGDKAFQSCGMITLNISDCETIIGSNAFSYCEDLTDVIIGANSMEIGEYCFYDCTSLVNVSIAADSEDDNLKIIIDDKALQSCSVQNVVIGRGKIEIGDSAFSYCEELVSVEIKGTLSDIGKYVFYDCQEELVITYDGGKYNKESIEEVR